MDRRARCRDSRFPVRALLRRMCGHCRSGLTTSLRDAILPSLYTHPHLFYGALLRGHYPCNGPISVSCSALAAALVARFELKRVPELGLGFDLDSCAATGATAELVYVSPKSGRAVSREAGEPWREKLLALPAFLGADGQGTQSGMPSAAELRDGFALTGFFLARHVYEPRGESLPESRYHFIAAAVGGA